MFNPTKILVLAPHTDDGELGCGGSMTKFIAAGKDVWYMAFSLCRKSLPVDYAADTLEKECKAALSIIGVTAGNILFNDFEVREFPKYRQPILEELVSLNKKIQPDLVFIPSANDVHQDHKVIHEEALRAFKNTSLLGYELPWNQKKADLSYFIPLSIEEVDKKVKAVQSYQSQAKRSYTQEEFIRSLAKVRGVQSNTEFAEAFEVYKIIG